MWRPAAPKYTKYPNTASSLSLLHFGHQCRSHSSTQRPHPRPLALVPCISPMSGLPPRIMVERSLGEITWTLTHGSGDLVQSGATSQIGGEEWCKDVGKYLVSALCESRFHLSAPSILPRRSHHPIRHCPLWTLITTRRRNFFRIRLKIWRCPEP